MARIVMMLNRLVIGGAPIDTAQLAGYLSGHHEVYLVVGDKNDDELDASHLTEHFSKLKVIHLSGMQRSLNVFKDLRSFFVMRRLLKELRPDIIHTHGAKSGLLGRLAAYGAGVKVIIHTYHGHVFHSYFNKFTSALIVKAEQLLARLSSKLIAISHTHKRELVNIYHICRENKMEVIKLGIDTARFRDDDGSRRKRFREKYHIAKNEVAVGIIGRIVPVKGPAFFAAVVEEILRLPQPSVKFFVIGDGLLRKDLQQLLLEKGISTSFSPAGEKPATVTFTSWLLDIEEAMNGLDIIMLTSLNEGTPVTLLEAQAAGKPVVATNVGGVSEVVLDEISGYISPYGDKTAFAAKVLRLAADPALRRSMGREGQLFMQKNHTQEQQFQSIEKLYLQLLEV